MEAGEEEVNNYPGFDSIRSKSSDGIKGFQPISFKNRRIKWSALFSIRLDILFLVLIKFGIIIK